MTLPPPTSTYRLQVQRDYTLADATALLDYLAGLGAGAVYLSPLLRSTSGSQHGYDTVDAGLRMGSMMSPLVALDGERRLVAAAGAAGGSRIRPALVQVLLAVLRGSAPQPAIDAPRLNALPDLVRAEPGFAEEVLAALAADGAAVAVAAGPDPYFGGVSAISALGAGADPRRNGSVVLL